MYLIYRLDNSQRRCDDDLCRLLHPIHRHRTGKSSDFQTGLDYLTNPVNEYGLANLEVFLSALVVSALMTFVVAEIENAQS